MSNLYATYLMVRKNRRKDAVKGGLLLGFLFVLIGGMFVIGTRSENVKTAEYNVTCRDGIPGSPNCRLG